MVSIAPMCRMEQLPNLSPGLAIRTPLLGYYPCGQQKGIINGPTSIAEWWS